MENAPCEVTFIGLVGIVFSVICEAFSFLTFLEPAAAGN